MDSEKYPIEELVELYGLRWQCEVDYRHIKTTLKMEDFDVKTPEMFRKELAVGLLTYNLICALIVKGAIVAGVPPQQLSFSSCTIRLLDVLHSGVPFWVYESNKLQEWLLNRIAKCQLPDQPNKVPHEPRKVRSRPQPFPTLKGSREDARKQVRELMAPENLIS
ncbi:MAG: transposase [Hormoscilla sp. GM102CHS1]|nr:transposase [Hormoscilla sp. GM102CHS1]